MCLKVKIKWRKNCADLRCDCAMDILNISFNISPAKERDRKAAFTQQSPVKAGSIQMKSGVSTLSSRKEQARFATKEWVSRPQMELM